MHRTPRPRRPFNRILVAQHVTMPQMWISCLVAVQVGEEANAAAGWSCARQAQPDMVHFPALHPSTPARPHWLLAVPVPLQHVGATYVFIHPLKMGYVGAAWSTTW